MIDTFLPHMIDLRGIVDEDFINYKLPSMYLVTSYCSFKCDKENGGEYCQNRMLTSGNVTRVKAEDVIERYIANPITKATVFGGLEPFDQFEEVLNYIALLREVYKNNDDVIIYTGYNKNEIDDKVKRLKYKNIIIKYGRYIPNQKPHFDDVLGVNLASDNQYAEIVTVK